MLTRRTYIAGLGGAAATLAGASAFDAVRYMHGASDSSSHGVPNVMKPVPIDPAWVIAGAPKLSASVTAETPDGDSLSGMWACIGPATFKWQYGFDETVHVIKGLVEIEYLGKRFTLKPGDIATFLGGTEAIWHVPERIEKFFTLHQPGKLVRALRRLERVIK